jgi:hypothetical protein
MQATRVPNSDLAVFCGIIVFVGAVNRAVLVHRGSLPRTRRASGPRAETNVLAGDRYRAARRTAEASWGKWLMRGTGIGGRPFTVQPVLAPTLA